MKLTVKDKEFLDILKPLLEERALRIELRDDGVKRLVLRQNYGDKISEVFGLTRQGVRWRFQRVADMYVSAYETILFVEGGFGVALRPMALTLARARAEARREALQRQGGSRR